MKTIEYRRASSPALISLDVGRADNLAPLLGFCSNEFSELGGRGRKHGAAQVGKPRLDLWIGESSIDLPVELLNDLRRRVPGDTDTLPNARLQAGHEIAHRRDVRQCWRASCGGYRQSAQLTGP